MKNQLTTFILFAAIITGCGPDDLTNVPNSLVDETTTADQLAVIQHHVESTSGAIEADTDTIETKSANNNAPTVVEQTQYVRVEKTADDQIDDTEFTADQTAAEYTLVSQKAEETEDADEDLCGNGIVDGDEYCDDGNDNDADWCSNDCLSMTDERRAEAILIEEDFNFGLGGFNVCNPVRCSGENCPTASAGAVHLRSANNYLCLPSIQVAARGRVVEHLFTVNANDTLDSIVLRDADGDEWRIVLNLRDGIIEYHAPQTGERTEISVDLDQAQGEQEWRVVFDSNAQASYIINGDTYLGALPFNAERVNNMMFSTHGTQSSDNAPTLEYYRVSRFN